MLNPQDRLMLTEALTPPPGFFLDYAVGTTYTLDLETALSVPLSLAAKRVSSDADPLSIMDALRRTEEHVDIFAQAGQISMANHSNLITLLERSVHAVSQPNGLFHPKVWFLQFANAAEKNVSRYRFVCASRNLTQDRSWDVVVQLEGKPGGADAVAQARERNAPLAGLLRRLPGMAIQPLPEDRIRRIEALAHDFETVAWDAPEGIRELRFHVFGPGGVPTPEMTGTRTLIVSPFVSDEGLRLLRGNSKRETKVISRVNELERLNPDSLDERLSAYIFDDAAELGSDEETVLSDAEDHSSAISPPQLLHGLHAKVVVQDQSNGSARIFIGSSNATWPGWHTNTEVMVELVGPRARFGVNRVLEELGQLKEEYEPQGGRERTAREDEEYELESSLRQVAAQRVTMRLVGDGPCDISVWAEVDAEMPPTLQTDTRLEWQLLGHQEVVAGGLPSSESHAHELHAVPTDQVTPFIVVTARRAGIVRRTIVIARILDDFEARRTAALTSHITDRAAFLRLLTMMLELSGFGAGMFGSGDGLGAFHAGAGESAGLMEALAKAFGHGAHAIKDVEEIVEFLRRDERQAAQVLPEGFDELWESLMGAYAATKRAQP